MPPGQSLARARRGSAGGFSRVYRVVVSGAGISWRFIRELGRVGYAPIGCFGSVCSSSDVCGQQFGGGEVRVYCRKCKHRDRAFTRAINMGVCLA